MALSQVSPGLGMPGGQVGVCHEPQLGLILCRKIIKKMVLKFECHGAKPC